MSVPKCPIKTAAFDRPDTCQPDCAWLVDVWRTEWGEEREYVGKACTFAVYTVDMRDYDVRPVNVLEAD